MAQDNENIETGLILNVQNAVFENDGKKITITIPVESFEEFGNIIKNRSESTRHIVQGKTYIGTSTLRIKKEGGFEIIEGKLIEEAKEPKV